MKTMISVRVDDAEVRRALKALPEKARQSAQRKGMRAALTPVRDALRSAWSAQPRRRTGKHTEAIVKATVTDARRGRGGTVVGKVGVNYKLGGTRSKQRIWHLLEAGFRHFGSSKAYAPRSRTVRAQAEARQKLYREAFNAAVKTNPGRSRNAKQAQWAALRAVTARAKQLFPELAATETQRRTGNKIRRAFAGRVAGLGISRRIGRAMLNQAMRDMAGHTLAAIKAGLRKGAA